MVWVFWKFEEMLLMACSLIALRPELQQTPGPVDLGRRSNTQNGPHLGVKPIINCSLFHLMNQDGI